MPQRGYLLQAIQARRCVHLIISNNLACHFNIGVSVSHHLPLNKIT
jgi:hypothetical protein